MTPPFDAEAEAKRFAPAWGGPIGRELRELLQRIHDAAHTAGRDAGLEAAIAECEAEMKFRDSLLQPSYAAEGCAVRIHALKSGGTNG